MNAFKKALDVFHECYVARLMKKNLREHLYETIVNLLFCLYCVGSMVFLGLVDEPFWSGFCLLLAVTFLCFLYLDWNTYVDRKTKT